MPDIKSTLDVAADTPKPFGFWACWSLTAGIMIGSGIFLLPAILVPFGLMSFVGWGVTAAGSLCIALVVSRLSARTRRSGGVYVYARDGFGDLIGFLVAWGYWLAYCISIPAIAIAFVGYLAVFIPALETSLIGQAGSALSIIWLLTLINMRSLSGAGFVQIFMTLLKLIPLIIIMGLAASTGQVSNLPAANPKAAEFLPALATTALLTMWAFSGLEAGAIPASHVKDAERTIPRAIIWGTLTVAFIYIVSTYCIMLLVPAEILATSSAPFSDAAAGLGAWAPKFIAVGAMIATAGSLNGVIFISGQMPMALAVDGFAPKIFARASIQHSEFQHATPPGPRISLLLSAVIGSVVLMLNYTKGLIDMFTFLAMMSTLAVLVPLLVSALAEFKYSWRAAKGWAGVAGLASLYSVFAILGSGWAVILWGVVLLLLGVPVYYLMTRARYAKA